MIDAILREIDLNHGFLETDEINTLYFGGGTPSVFSSEELSLINRRIKRYFSFKEGLELTLEANPDDLSENYLCQLKSLGINRLSVGIQSFFDDDLQLMNRSHDAAQARKVFRLMRATGFDDYSIDLIFGMPRSNLEKWQQNLDEALSYQAPHFSFYNLTVEPRTALEHMIRKGTVVPLEEEKMAEQFLFTIDYMEKAGYEHYEISNYALPGRYAKHNTAYWQGNPYLGIGPSAHSFKGNIRQWNIANNPNYIKSIREGVLPAEREILSLADQYNEYIMTGLRTMWGVSSIAIENSWPDILTHFNELIDREIEKGRIKKQEDSYVLTRNGKLFADEVASNLFTDVSVPK